MRKILLASLVLTFTLLPVVASAGICEDLDAQIAEWQKKERESNDFFGAQAVARTEASKRRDEKKKHKCNCVKYNSDYYKEKNDSVRKQIVKDMTAEKCGKPTWLGIHVDGAKAKKAAPAEKRQP